MTIRGHDPVAEPGEARTTDEQAVREHEQAVREHEQALVASEQRFRSLAEAMPQIVWTATLDGTITFMNQNWTDFTGLTLEQTNDLAAVSRVFHPDDMTNAFARWAHSLETGEPHEVQWRFRRASDGAYRWFLTRAVPFRGADGRVIEWFGTATDIHEQKLAEERLRELDRRKDEFLATLGHELRNPLNPIAAAVQVLRRTGASSEQRANAEDVLERQLAHLTRLVDDLLDIERITHHRLELRLEGFDLARAIESALEASRPAVVARRHEVVVHGPGEPLPVMADLTRLAQVFSNLLVNAAKYTDDGGTVTIDVHRDDAHAVVSVRDTGIGIAPDQLAHVFEMFSQLTPAIQRSQGGLGIGLALVRGIVHMHGGTVEARSGGPGQGSEFVVRLPLAAQPEVPTASEEGPIEARPRRVLVVDDLVDAADMVADLLRVLGHEVEVAHDGEAALACVASWQPEVVLLDIGLPVLNGYDVARRIRTMTPGRAPLLIALTGWGQEADQRAAREAGFDEHMTKPIDLSRLRKLLH